MIYFPLIMPRLLFDYFLVVDFSLIRGFYRGLSFDVNSLTDNSVVDFIVKSFLFR